MRNPAFWLPSGSSNWVGAYGGNNGIMPNIAGLAQKSFSFPNYWVAATICGPSRACLLTGLYSQQTCIFKSQLLGNATTNNSHPTEVMSPPLLPYNNSWDGSSPVVGFPTIGNVLSQVLPIGNSTSNSQYDCTWIGKWHVSCQVPGDGNPGSSGPIDYGFADRYSLPNSNSTVYPAGPSGYPSPNGYDNEGTGGDFLDAFTQTPTPAHDVPDWSVVLGNNSNFVPNFTQVNDAAIAYAFTNGWLPYASGNLNLSSNNGQPYWFCAVSFINPHDIEDFPFSFNLNSSNSNFGNASTPDTYYYQPPPLSSANYTGNNCAGGPTACVSDGDVVSIPSLPTTYSALPPGAGNAGPWNWEDISSMPYANNSGKPGLQLAFQISRSNQSGSVHSPGTYNASNNTWPTPTGWVTFLNYYLWMQSCVDYQVGQVLGTGNNGTTKGLLQYPNIANNTVVIFTSDHGEYGGAHSLRTKGGGLYEEAMNVPFLVSYPSMRNNASLNGPILLPYVCSGVDLLPFLYTLALGNASWRTNLNDMIYYLRGREDMMDAIMQYAGNNSNTSIIQQRRISGIPLANNFGSANWQMYQPFVLHTADDTTLAALPPDNNSTPSHAIAFRTVDLTDPSNNSAPFFGQNSYGGGKLGIYGYWDTCSQNSAPIMGINSNAATANQYEFYNYSLNPYTGNNNLSQNLQELGNQFFFNNSNAAQGQIYYEDFFNTGFNSGSNIQNELYNLNTHAGNGNATQQVSLAIQTAFDNYIQYLTCANNTSGSNGQQSINCRNNTCGNYAP